MLTSYDELHVPLAVGWQGVQLLTSYSWRHNFKPADFPSRVSLIQYLPLLPGKGWGRRPDCVFVFTWGWIWMAHPSMQWRQIMPGITRRIFPFVNRFSLKHRLFFSRCTVYYYNTDWTIWLSLQYWLDNSFSLYYHDQYNTDWTIVPDRTITTILTEQ